MSSNSLSIFGENTQSLWSATPLIWAYLTYTNQDILNIFFMLGTTFSTIIYFTAFKGKHTQSIDSKHYWIAFWQNVMLWGSWIYVGNFVQKDVFVWFWLYGSITMYAYYLIELAFTGMIQKVWNAVRGNI